MGKLLDFLFGKNPDIFDSNGEVRHKLPKNKWEAWKKKYFSDPSYNWKNHSGTKAVDRSKSRHSRP